MESKKLIQNRFLLAAAIYNLVWGTHVVVWPKFYFALFQIPLPNYPEFWQCIGMIVAVYGLGYLIAATDPQRHWPIVFVGLLGKIFGPIGFLKALALGKLPMAFGVIIFFNDVIWWIPFGVCLWKVLQCHLDAQYRKTLVR